jgi:muconolactone delta-isomerase
VEYLVTMTTHVPDGTPEDKVEDVKAREAAHSRELAEQGHLLRLWRPPLAPGEWRSLGLFAADGDDEIERVLASMPLRIWRTDEVTPLSPHPNDPPARSDAAPPGTPGQEFLTTFTIVIPDGTPAGVISATERHEADRAGEMARHGHLFRLWALPPRQGTPRTLGLWRADDPAQMQEILDGLPLSKWMTAETTPLTPHPSDPASAS